MTKFYNYVDILVDVTFQNGGAIGVASRKKNISANLEYSWDLLCARALLFFNFKLTSLLKRSFAEPPQMLFGVIDVSKPPEGLFKLGSCEHKKK